MAIHQDYEKKRLELQKQLQTMKEFEKTDKVVNHALEISRNVVRCPADYKSIPTILEQGRQLTGYLGPLGFKSNEAWGEYKVAEVAWKHVKDGLLLAYKGEKLTATEARAQAGREMTDAEVDTIAREQRYKNYEIAIEMCDKVVSFIQTTIGYLKTEKLNAGQIGDGRV